MNTVEKERATLERLFKLGLVHEEEYVFAWAMLERKEARA